MFSAGNKNPLVVRQRNDLETQVCKGAQGAQRGHPVCSGRASDTSQLSSAMDIAFPKRNGAPHEDSLPAMPLGHSKTNTELPN